MDISETIAAGGLKNCRCRQLIQYTKVIIEGQCHFDLVFPGFVCFVLILNPDIR